MPTATADNVETALGLQIFSRLRSDLETVEIRPYDFKRPERIGKDQLRALRSLHETFARSFGAQLTGYLRAIVELEISSVEQMTYAEFVGGLAHPTCFCLISASELDGQVCLEVSPDVYYPVIDRLLGGSSQQPLIPKRPLTLIETRLVRNLLDRAMPSLTESWSSLRETEFHINSIETNPQIVQIVPPNELVVVVTLETQMAGRSGTMHLGVPMTVIEPFLEELNAQNWALAGRHGDEDVHGDRMTARLRESTIEVTGVLAQTTMTVSELRSLEVGDLITTDKPATAAATLKAEGRPKFLANLGQRNGNRALRVLRRCEPGDRV